jgi:uncharacterized membrane-anchored protein
VDAQLLTETLNILGSLKFKTGKVQIGENLATLEVPSGMVYLDGPDAQKVLHKVWGNPEDTSIMGMLLRDSASVFSNEGYGVAITYSGEGHVDDKDAASIDYDELLAQMREGMSEANAIRKENGFPPVKVLGWASKPFYDAANKKIHWAKSLLFGEQDSVLNYNIRVLGREGFLELNFISSIYMLDTIKQEINPILAAVNFIPGQQYNDYDASTDKLAGYGIAGLIAGGIATKAGFFAKLGILLAKGWKIILLAIVGIGTLFRKIFGKKQSDQNNDVA